METLLETFSHYFEVVEADTDALREVVFRLRYQVYCVETGYEDKAAFPDEMERDAYEPCSYHALLRHRATGWWAGTVRLVKPGVAGHLPMERSLPNLFEPETVPYFRLNRARTAEISRFAVTREFRRRYREYLSPSGVSDDRFEKIHWHSDNRERRVAPHLALGLMQAIVLMSKKYGIDYWGAIMEPKLLRLLAHLGIHFYAIGPLVDYHGRRQPCVARLDELLAGVQVLCPEVWGVITRDGTLLEH